MAIDNKRRTTLKVMALATTAVAAPSIVNAACNHGVGKESVATTALRGTGLIVSFDEKVGSDGSRQVIVTNTNEQSVTLSQVYPGIVSTPDGQYDLNSLLNEGSRKFAPKQATTLTIKPANTNLVNKQKQPMGAADSLLSVRTRNPYVNAGDPVTTMRNMFS